VDPGTNVRWGSPLLGFNGNGRLGKAAELARAVRACALAV
jgi:hypothetical protein